MTHLEIGDDAFVNRELSWLAFNERVLDQARDPHWPLLERLKFLAIFGSNLDEFFMIRVSGLHDQLAAELGAVAGAGLLAREQLSAIRSAVLSITDSAARLFAETLLPELERAGIRLRNYEALNPVEALTLRDYFRSHVFPILTPLAVDPVHPFPFLSNLSLSLAVEAIDPTTGERRFARIKVPESLSRFVPLPLSSDAESASAEGARDFIPLEDVIAGNLAELFPGMHIVGAWPFRVTRDMDIDILEDEAEDLLALVDREIRKRRFGAAVRLEIDSAVPLHIQNLLLEKLELEADDLYRSDGLLGFSGLFAVASLPRRDLRDPPLRQRLPADWDDQDPFGVIAKRDLLLHHPYESFSPVLDLLQRAAEDPNVLAIKMTLYRAGANAEVVRTLIRAAETGKQVAVAVELKARFDEENNIGWARALERVGAHVFYGAAGLKTHAKALLIVRREANGLRRYVHLSTGNYNASTAKLYTDYGWLTTNTELGEDVSDLFNSLSGFSREPGYRRLAVAPASLRAALLSKIEAQTARAERGQPSRIFGKLNSLVDPEIIRALYRASQAGVSVQLLVRGICCLRPQLEGYSENIRVHSLIGRFLEHERLYVFGEGKDEEFFLSSADWMQRNLDRRVELLFPIEDERLRDRLRSESLRPFEEDNSRVYEMDSQGQYHRRQPGPGARAINAQDYAQDRVAEALAHGSNGAAPNSSVSAA